MAHFHDYLSQRQTLAVGKLVLRCRLGFSPEPKERALFGHLIVERAVGGVQVDRGSGALSNAADAEHVVEMRVGQPDRRDAAVCLRRGGEKALGLLAGVDHDGLGRIGMVDEVAILCELPVGERNYCEARDRQLTSAGARLRRSARYFSTAIAAVVASPTAVVTWRVSWARRSPAAKSPGTEVIMRSSVIK